MKFVLSFSEFVCGWQDLENRLNNKESLQKIFANHSEGEPTLISFVNPYSFQKILEHDLSKDVDVWFADGSSLVFLVNLFRRRSEKIDRVSFDFTSIAGKVFSKCEERGLKVALIGGSPFESNEAVLFFKKSYPEINIKLARNGFMDKSEQRQVIKEIVDADMDIVILGMGTPFQEHFGNQVKNTELRNCLIFTCGGFLSQTGQQGVYYHPLIKKLGARWLQRAFSSHHVRLRLIKDYPRFILKFFVVKLALWLGWTKLQ